MILKAEVASNTSKKYLGHFDAAWWPITPVLLCKIISACLKYLTNNIYLQKLPENFQIM